MDTFIASIFKHCIYILYFVNTWYIAHKAKPWTQSAIRSSCVSSFMVGSLWEPEFILSAEPGWQMPLANYLSCGCAWVRPGARPGWREEYWVMTVPSTTISTYLLLSNSEGCKGDPHTNFGLFLAVFSGVVSFPNTRLHICCSRWQDQRE